MKCICENHGETTRDFSLRILTGKKHPKIKLQRLQKIQILTFGSLVQQINSFQEVLKLEQTFQKNQVVNGKVVYRLFDESHFQTSVLIV